jgi:hypothetical protein
MLGRKVFGSQAIRINKIKIIFRKLLRNLKKYNLQLCKFVMQNSLYYGLQK